MSNEYLSLKITINENKFSQAYKTDSNNFVNYTEAPLRIVFRIQRFIVAFKFIVIL